MVRLPERYRDSVSADIAFAIIVFVIFVLVPVQAHTTYPEVLGNNPNLLLYMFAAVGMALSFALFVGPSQRLLAFFPGLIAGVGGIFLYLDAPWLRAVFEPLVFHRWPFFILALGAAPGALLFLGIRHLRRADRAH